MMVQYHIIVLPASVHCKRLAEGVSLRAGESSGAPASRFHRWGSRPKEGVLGREQRPCI